MTPEVKLCWNCGKYPIMDGNRLLCRRCFKGEGAAEAHNQNNKGHGKSGKE